MKAKILIPILVLFLHIGLAEDIEARVEVIGTIVTFMMLAIPIGLGARIIDEYLSDPENYTFQRMVILIVAIALVTALAMFIFFGVR